MKIINITWWLAQYNRHSWLEVGFSSERNALAESNSTRNSAQNSAALLYMFWKVLSAVLLQINIDHKWRVGKTITNGPQNVVINHHKMLPSQRKA